MTGGSPSLQRSLQIVTVTVLVNGSASDAKPTADHGQDPKPVMISRQ